MAVRLYRDPDRPGPVVVVPALSAPHAEDGSSDRPYHLAELDVHDVLNGSVWGWKPDTKVDLAAATCKPLSIEVYDVQVKAQIGQAAEPGGK
jgi:hypothetical protein